MDSNYIGITNHRLNHSIGVARFMYNEVIRNGGSEEYAREIFTLGYLHDIGYDFTGVKVNHPMVGGVILKSTGYKYWREVYYHGDVSGVYESSQLDLLNKADLSVDSHGNIVSVKDRLSGLWNR